MTDHTPTPWETEPGAWVSGAHAHRRAIVATCCDDGAIAEAAQKANAAFICKAVNNHDALIVALIQCVDRLQMVAERRHPNSNGFIPVVDAALECAKVALSQAGVDVSTPPGSGK